MELKPQDNIGEFPEDNKLIKIFNDLFGERPDVLGIGDLNDDDMDRLDENIRKADLDLDSLEVVAILIGDDLDGGGENGGFGVREPLNPLFPLGGLGAELVLVEE